MRDCCVEYFMRCGQGFATIGGNLSRETLCVGVQEGGKMGKELFLVR
jgi:hypothetical protein